MDLILAKNPNLLFLFNVEGWYVFPLFPPLVPHRLCENEPTKLLIKDSGETS